MVKYILFQPDIGQFLAWLPDVLECEERWQLSHHLDQTEHRKSLAFPMATQNNKECF